MLVPSVTSSVLATLRARRATLLLPVPILPSVSASRPTASAMECVGTSHTDVARRVSPGEGATTLSVLLARPCVVSPTAGKVMIVLISQPMLRVVSDLALVVRIAILRTGIVGGGCTVASPFGGNVADGKNCKTIPNVEKVLCDSGTCKVLSCEHDFKVSRFNDSCVKLRLDRVRQARGVEIVDEVLDLLVHEHLLVDAFDVIAAKQRLLADVEVLDCDHVLQALLLEGAIVGIHDLPELKKVLGLGGSVL